MKRNHPIPGKRCWDKKCRVCKAAERVLEEALALADREPFMVEAVS